MILRDPDQDPPVLRVDLEHFAATVEGSSFVLKWATAAEFDNTGFHIYRANEDGTAGERLTASLIPPKGDELTGASYTLVDPVPAAAGETRSYLLEDVELGGKRTLHGPATATAGPDATGDGLAGDEDAGALDLLANAEWTENATVTYNSPVFAELDGALLLSTATEGDTFGFYQLATPAAALEAGTYSLVVDVNWITDEGAKAPDLRVRVSTADHGSVAMAQVVDVDGRDMPETILVLFTSDGVSDWFVALDLLAFLGQDGTIEITGVTVTALD